MDHILRLHKVKVVDLGQDLVQCKKEEKDEETRSQMKHMTVK